MILSLNASAQLSTQLGQSIGLLPGRCPDILSLLQIPSQRVSNAPTSVQVGGVAAPATSTTKCVASVPSVEPQEVYNGGYSDNGPIRLRIANGGAGQNGLIREWANAFIQHMVLTNQSQPFRVAWYLGDTTDSLAMLAAGVVDVAATYNEAAEQVLIDRKDATNTVYALRGYFALVGPKSNPAKLDPDADNLLAMLSKIAEYGKIDDQRPPKHSERLPVRFLSRFDKSATNIRECELFLKIGEIPWSYAYAKWYHQYPQFPTQSLRAASVLGEYTLTDTAIIAAVAKSDQKGFLDDLDVFRAGCPGGRDADLLLNPCHILLGAKADHENLEIAEEFMRWIDDEKGGRNVIRVFGENGKEGLFEPPTSNC